jgi:hypothetical protein
MKFYLVFILQILFFTSCDNNFREIIDFTKIETLLRDTALSRICIRTIPSNSNYNKFIFVNHGEVFTINKGFFKTKIYGNNFSEISPERAIEEFKYYSDVLESKGIIGSCLAIDSLIMLKMDNFNINCLQVTDTLHEYKNYKYLCVTKKDIRLTFVHHEYYSDLFYIKPFYFFYSNK